MQRLSINTFFLLFLIPFLVSFIPHLARLPLWISFFCIFFCTICLFSDPNKWPLFNRPLRITLSIACFFGVLLYFGRANGRDAGVALLCLMLTLKCLEMQSKRDHILILSFLYFMIITNLLYFETLGMTLYLFPSVIITTTSLIKIIHPKGSIKQNLKKSLALVTQALPIMIIFFLAFPRIQGSFWGSPISSSAGTSGFSETMAPGTITSLARSDAIAFRATFADDAQIPSSLYWRGMVLWDFDGRTWTRPRTIPFTNEISEREPDLAYKIQLEPHNLKWLFSLDYPVTPPEKTLLARDGVIRRYYRVKKLIQYTGASTQTLPVQPLQPWEKRSLAFPENSNPRTKELVQSLLKETPSHALFIASVEAFFRTNNFLYTLSPPPLGDNSIDDFLFTSKKGFCEHYASSFAYMMRVANIPARVVTGYLGGEKNPFGNYHIIRQSDAHAWCEVWLEGQGWIRIDPTLFVSPSRIESDVGEILPEETAGFFKKLGLDAILIAYYRLQFSWDVLTTYWNNWVLDYTLETQQSLFTRLGLSSFSWKVALSLLAVFSLIMAVLLYVVLMRYKRLTPKEPSARLYAQFCKKLEKLGIIRRQAEGPRDFSERVVRLRPDLASIVHQVTKLYIRLRYADTFSAQSAAELRHIVKRFNPNNYFAS